MVCNISQPVYRPPVDGGINFVSSQNDGYTILVQWDKAWPSKSTYNVGYNIYYSTVMNDVFEEGVKFVALDDGYLNACIIDLDPGITYWFGIRATEHDQTWMDLSLLPDGIPDLKVYPEGLLLSDIDDSTLTIPVSNINDWPAFGVIQVGTELIRYSSKDVPSSTLIGSTRGFLDTNIRFHNTDGYDGVTTQDPIVRFWKGFEDSSNAVMRETSTFAHPNYAFTFADGYAKRADTITTDLTSSDSSLEDFPAYDHVGWHRTDPRLLFDGKCIGTYIGGEQFCADGYAGVGRQIRGIPFGEHAARREEELLNIDGESVVLVKRLWEGIRCACVFRTTEQPERKCPRCFIPGTLVKTEFGWKAIEEIKVDERVLSSDGKYHKVTETHVRYYEGDILGINTSVTPEPIWTTPEHPFLVMRSSHNINRNCGPKCDEYIKNGDGRNFCQPHDIRQLPNSNWHARASIDGNRVALGSFADKNDAIQAIDNFRNTIKPKHAIKWDTANNIIKNDWLVARWNKEIKKINTIEIPYEFRKNTKLGSQRLGPDEFILDNEFMWMVGIYLAEGSSGKRTISFALHKDEIEYQNRLLQYFEKLGYNPIVRNSGSENGVAVEVYSTTLSKWFPELFGKYCYNKEIPEELMHLSYDMTWSLIKGIWDGDGTKSCNEIGQTSKILALQLVELLHRVGEQPLVRKQISNALTPSGNKRRTCYVVSWAEKTAQNSNRKGRWSFDDEILTRVNSVSKLSYSGKVYNLEVEGDHTYVVQGVVVHNCFGTGFVTGYEQFFNSRRSDGRILVRPSPANDDLKFYNAGLESEIIIDFWTIGYPAIKDRDFIIRFNPDGTEEFRYEVLDVTRNKLFGQQFGGQKFKAQRVRKSDPIYMWRAIRSTATMPQTLATSIGFLRGPGGTTIPHTHDIVINEGIVSLGQVNQTTSVSEDHNHEIIDGVVQEKLGHTHTIVLP